MEIFLELLYQIAPLYVTILLGFLAGKILKPHKEDISSVLFYVITPIVVFSGIAKVEFSLAILTVPILVYIIGTIMSIIVYYSTSRIIKDSMRNILAFSSGTSSMGYFGLPVAMIVFADRPQVVSIYVAACVGMMVFENSSGFYWIARNSFSKRDCFKKLYKLPTLYASVGGFIFAALDLEIPGFLDAFIVNTRGAYITLGMMVVGLGIASIQEFFIDWRMVLMTFLVKYMIWPMLIFAFVLVDKFFFNFYYDDIYISLIVLAIIPVSVSSVVLGTVFNYPADRIAIVVLINILIGLLYVPMMISIFIK